MSSKSKTSNEKQIHTLIAELITTDMYHPQVIHRKNQQLNQLLVHKLATTSHNKHLYQSIKDITDQLDVLSHAAISQPIVVRMVTNQRFQQIQLELRRLQHQLKHRKA